MSFILDALKKSESDRQRQSGPALFEVRVAPPRTRLPLWAVAIALLLVVNLGVAMWMLLRHQAHSPGSAPSAAAPPPAAAASAPPASPVPVVTASAPAAAGAAPPAALTAPAAVGAAVSSATPAAPTAATAGSDATGSTTDSTNAEDNLPAQEPAASGVGNHVRRGTASGVPLYEDVSATPGTRLPQLRLDLHVFAARQQDRFVMINMHKLREGDALPEGVHVDSITPEGAVLSYNGSKFLLPRD